MLIPAKLCVKTLISWFPNDLFGGTLKISTFSKISIFFLKIGLTEKNKNYNP